MAYTKLASSNIKATQYYKWNYTGNPSSTYYTTSFALYGSENYEFINSNTGLMIGEESGSGTTRQMITKIAFTIPSGQYANSIKLQLNKGTYSGSGHVKVKYSATNYNQNNLYTGLPCSYSGGRIVGPTQDGQIDIPATNGQYYGTCSELTLNRTFGPGAHYLYLYQPQYMAPLYGGVGWYGNSQSLSAFLSYQTAYRLDYNKNGGSSQPSTQYVTAGSAVTLNAAIAHAASTGTYIIYYNANGGTSSLPPSQNASTTLTYTFSKWRLNSTSGTSYAAKASYTPTANCTMYATWTTSRTTAAITLAAAMTKTSTTASSGNKVYYNANGGSSTPSTNSSQVRTTAYTFAKWRLNGTSGTSYAAKASYTPTATCTMYATWTSTTSDNNITLATSISRANGSTTGYGVYYNANGGSSTPSTQTSTRTVKYTFDKWRLNSTSGTSYAAGASYKPTATCTMYATWTVSYTNNSITLASAIARANSTGNASFSVTFNPNGGTTTKTSQTPVNTYKYTFAKWRLNSTSGTSYAASASYAPTAACTMYATWTTTTTTAAVTCPTAAQCTRPGYELLGWSTSSTATTASYNPGASYQASAATTLYAVWKGLGCVYIHNGTTFEAYEIYIHNGTSWDGPYDPYIYSGSAWEPYG